MEAVQLFATDQQVNKVSDKFNYQTTNKYARPFFALNVLLEPPLVLGPTVVACPIGLPYLSEYHTLPVFYQQHIFLGIKSKETEIEKKSRCAVLFLFCLFDQSIGQTQSKKKNSSRHL